MSDPLDRINDQLSVINSKLSRVEATMDSVLGEQKKTNGRVTVGEEWRRAHDILKAGRDGETRARAESLLSRKAAVGLLSVLGTVTGIAATIGTLIAREL